MKLYTSLPDVLPISFVVEILIRRHRQKSKLDPRLISSKLTIMDELVVKYEFPSKCYDDVFLWVAKFLDDPNI